MKILFFAHDPGGMNAIKPLIEPLESSGAEVKASFKEFSFDELEVFKPDLVITGTSANDKTEKVIWQKAKEKSIKTIAILDHWCNYGIRFSRYGLLDIDKFNKDPDIFPDYIIVMDDFAKNEMIADGVPEDIILPLGNPHFKDIKIREKKYDEKFQNTVLFASEPYIEDYGNGPEKIAAKDIYDFCQENSLNLIIKLHPKEDISKYKEFASKNVSIIKEPILAELMQKSNIIISMTSMVLIEAAILGLSILSYQPTQADKDKFLLTKREILPFINNKVDLCKYLDQILLKEKPLEYNFCINFDADKNIINFIKGELWRN